MVIDEGVTTVTCSRVTSIEGSGTSVTFTKVGIVPEARRFSTWWVRVASKWIVHLVHNKAAYIASIRNGRYKSQVWHC